MEEDSDKPMKWYVLVILAAVVFVYLCLGGVAFHYLEAREETGYKDFVRNFTQQFLEEHKCVTEDEMEFMVLTYIRAHDRGIIEVANKSSATNWDLASSVFFAVTVITTIGYGNIYPITSGGQAFCVIYAILGIPLSLALLAGIGQKLKHFSHWLNKLMSCRPNHRKTEEAFRIVFIVILGLSLFLFLPAMMFVFIDGWNYTEALYYAVITLTTIGFGDLVPGLEDTPNKKRSVYRLMVALWIFVGLAWVAGAITVLQELYTTCMDKAEKRVKKTIKLAPLDGKTDQRDEEMTASLPHKQETSTDAPTPHAANGSRTDKGTTDRRQDDFVIDDSTETHVISRL